MCPAKSPEYDRKQSAGERSVAVQFLRWQDVPGLTIVVRAVMEPQRQYIEGLLHVGGATWEQHQRWREARALACGERGTGLRDYRVLVAVRGDLEEKCTERTISLMTQTSSWNALPVRMRNASLRSTAFCMLSSALCMLNEIRAIFESHPFSIFRVLENDNDRDFLADLQQGTSECERGDFANWILSLLKLMTVEDVLQVLRTIALYALLDNGPLEASHTIARRLLMMMSVQTAMLSLDMLNAEWICSRMRRLRRKLDHFAKSGVPTAADGAHSEGLAAGSAAPPAKKKIIMVDGREKRSCRRSCARVSSRSPSLTLRLRP